MTFPPALVLPAPDGYSGWLGERGAANLEAARASAQTLRSQSSDLAPSEAIAEWNRLNIFLGNALSAASLFSSVHPEVAVRDQADAIEVEGRRLHTELGLDRELFAVMASLDEAALEPEAKRLLLHVLRDFRRSGVDQDDETRHRLQALSDELTAVGQTFSNNIRDAVGRVLVDPARLAGLPEDFLASHQPDADGLVEITTEYPDYVPVMSFATDRALREELTRLFLNRAYPDNEPVLKKMLALRAENAAILGYPDWPSFDAEVKMIGSGPAIGEFIERISSRAREAAERDFEVLLQRVRQDLPEAASIDTVDKSFYSEVVRREKFEVDAQKVRQYFDFAKVRQGLLDVTSRLFGLVYVPIDDALVWHDEVTAYDVLDQASRRCLGRIYLDLHPRPGKYGHAAQFDLVSGVSDVQLPEGVLVCNFSRGLMEHDEVVTLFHEFGHLVHHVLGGDQRFVRFSGVATEWDFVEAPSQMLEEWAWDHRVLAQFATNAAGESISPELVQRMRTAEEFGKGLSVRTQMFYAALAYVSHRDVAVDLTELTQQAQARYDLFSYLPDTHFHDSFGHLGGYTSAYYTYMWSQVIAKDMFSAFDPNDLFAPEVAHRYRDMVLSRGGADDAARLVENFLGRPYSYDAFEGWLAQ